MTAAGRLFGLQPTDQQRPAVGGFVSDRPGERAAERVLTENTKYGGSLQVRVGPGWPLNESGEVVKEGGLEFVLAGAILLRRCKRRAQREYPRQEQANERGAPPPEAAPCHNPGPSPPTWRSRRTNSLLAAHASAKPFCLSTFTSKQTDRSALLESFGRPEGSRFV